MHPKGKPSKIKYVDGDSDNDYYCLECARKYKKLLDFGADGIQRNCSKVLRLLEA